MAYAENWERSRDTKHTTQRILAQMKHVSSKTAVAGTHARPNPHVSSHIVLNEKIRASAKDPVNYVQYLNVCVRNAIIIHPESL